MSQLENTVLQIIKENNLRYKWNEKISLELKDIKLDSKKSIRLVKGSHIITKSLYNQKKAFTLQNEDNRIIFVIPYKDEYSLLVLLKQRFFLLKILKLMKVK